MPFSCESDLRCDSLRVARESVYPQVPVRDWLEKG